MLAKTVFDLVQTLSPLAICDTCVAQKVGARADTVKKVTDPLGLTSAFKRYPGLCSRCGRDALVTRAG